MLPMFIKLSITLMCGYSQFLLILVAYNVHVFRRLQFFIIVFQIHLFNRFLVNPGDHVMLCNNVIILLMIKYVQY